MFKKILVALDFSPHSSGALLTAADLAVRFGAFLTLLHVHDAAPYALSSDFELFTVEQRDRLREQIEKALAAAQQQATAAGVGNVQTRLLEGAPANVIARYAEEGGFDLIVLGTHGRRGFQHALLGSVAERVVRLAPCPVLTVRPVGGTEAGKS